MKDRKIIYLPVVTVILGILLVVAGRQGQVSADIPSTVGASSSVYLLLVAAGFLLIAVAAIIALFILASNAKR